MSEATKEIAKRDESPAHQGPRGIVIRQMADLMAFSSLYARSGMAPKGMSPEAIAIAIQTGMELGLSPAQSVQSIGVINGRPSVYGPTAQALIESSGLMEDIDIYFEEDGKKTDHPVKFSDTTTAVCVTLRKGRKRSYTTRFSVADAKRAGLWGKAGPWTQYPQRMLKWRVTSHNFADNFGDVLKGLDANEPQGEIDIRVIPEQKPKQPEAEESAARQVAIEEARAAYKTLIQAKAYGPEEMASDLNKLFKAETVSQLSEADVIRWAKFLADKVASLQEPDPSDRQDGLGDAHDSEAA